MKSIDFSCYRGENKIVGEVWGADGTLKPAVILCHGFLSNAKMCFDYAKLVASLGYVAFTFDFCGGGLMCRSGGRSVDMTILTEVEDLKAVVAYVSSLEYVDSSNITLLGCSLGGVVSAIVAKQLQDKIKNLILLYPAFCIPDDARAGKMLFYKFDPDNLKPVVGRFPMALGAGYVRSALNLNLKEQISGYSGNVLYLQGTKDNVVNISYARWGKEQYPNCTYLEIEGGGHVFSGRADRTARTQITTFLSIDK
jgi:hypothetical protein